MSLFQNIPEARRHFVSDNNSGVIPELWPVLAQVNAGHVHAYGGDIYTEQCIEMMKKHFGKSADIFFVFNGTAANVVALQLFCKSFESIICSDLSHIQNDECGAPEKYLGSKLVLCQTKDAKLTIEMIQQKLIRLGDQHWAQPKIISLTQPTELGTTYSLEEIQKIVSFAKQHKLKVHIDGSRLVNAATHLKCSLLDLSEKMGVDVVSFGGTKNGLMGAEAIIVYDKELAKQLKFYRKQSMQLAGKMRYLSAQFMAWLQDDSVWMKYSKHACEMAQYLKQEVQKLDFVQVTQEVQSNAVFAIIPKKVVQEVRKEFFFYVWNEHTFECRWMCSWDTQKSDIDAFVVALQKANKA